MLLATGHTQPIPAVTIARPILRVTESLISVTYTSWVSWLWGIREKWCPGPRNGHAEGGGFPHEVNLRWGQGVGLVDEVAEGALQGQGFGGAGAGGFDGAGVMDFASCL